MISTKATALGLASSLALATALGAAPGSPGLAERTSFVDQVEGIEESHPSGLEQAIAEALQGHRGAAEAARQIEQSLRLPAGAGEPLVRGVVGARLARVREDLTESEFRGVEADLLAAFDRLRDPALSEELAQLYAAERSWPPAPKLYETIGRSDRPGELALALVERGCCGESQRDLLAAALAGSAAPQGAERARLLLRLAEELDDAPAWRLAALEAAVQADGSPAVASAWLSALFQLGLGRQAAAFFDALPQESQAQLLAAAPQGRLALDLAAARWLAGDARGALTQLSDTAAAPQAELLRELIAPRLADPFPLLAAALAADAQGTSGIWSLAIAALAERSGYPEIAAERRLRLPADSGDPVPAAWSAAVQAWGRELAARSERPDSPAEAAPGRLGQLLAQPALRPWREQPLPRGVAPAGEEAAPQVLPASFALPSGASPSRWARRDREVAVLVASEDYDPAGGMWQEGSYWVLRSHDGGRSWSSALPTGLQVGLPYVVAEGSRLPLATAGGLQAEVDLYASADPEHIELRQRGLALQIPWAELERDSDHDGLTDLAEESLLTDPGAADSDGDGIADPLDLLPQVAFAADLSPRAALRDGGLSAVVDWMAERDRRPRRASRTRFLVADRALFRGLSRPADRLVVLSETEARAAVRKRGALSFQSLPLFVLDRSGRHGLAVWSEAGAGGVLRLELGAGDKWRIEAVADWAS